MAIKLSTRGALILFIVMAVAAFGQAVWWIIFMAHLVNVKVDMAQELGASAAYVQAIHEQEIGRQIMLGSEGVFFLVVVLIGAWMIYRALVATEKLKFQQQNFLMTVTHELKTPLASLHVYLDTLQSEKITDAKKKLALPRMKTDIFRLERMVEDILEASRFDRRQYQLSIGRFNLTKLVEESIKDIERIPTEVPRTITKDLQSDVYFDGDEQALKRAITAVLENGLKYHDGKKIDLNVELSTISQMITLTVTDHGIGLAKADSEAIFERFYRVGSEMTRRTSGTGLGLYLCREIIKAHDGEIKAVSEGPGKGARFVITFTNRASR
jgi:signal transduction histidine kinase